MGFLARAGALSSLLALGLACGARNGLLDDAPADGGGVDSSRPDGARPDGAPPDGSRPDATVPDAGVERCEPSVVLMPKQIGFSPTDQSADRPQVERRDDAYYLLHAMRAADGSLTPYGNPYDFVLEPFGGLSSAIAGATEPYVTATNDRFLGYCFETAAGVTLAGDPSPPLSPGEPNTRVSYDFGGHCQELVSNGSTWLVAFTSELGPRGREPLFLITTPDLMGLVTMPAPAFRETFAPEREVRATALLDGSYAYTAQPTRERLLEVGFVDEGSLGYTVVLDDVSPTGSPPAIAPWPFDRELVAIAHNFPDGVRVMVVGRDGREVLRTEAFTFSMAGDVSPAVVALPGALLVATLNYGDFDPFGGEIQVHVVDADGGVREVFGRETRRGSLSYGGIDAHAEDGWAVVYWAETAETPIGPAATTQALIVECQVP